MNLHRVYYLYVVIPGPKTHTHGITECREVHDLIWYVYYKGTK